MICRKLKNEEKNCSKKRKELLTKLELEEARAAAKKNEEIRKIVEENYGEVDGSNLEIFRRVMQEQSGQMKQRKEHLKTELNGCDQSEKKYLCWSPIPTGRI